MFTVALFGLRRAEVRPPWCVKLPTGMIGALCALSGLLMTALYVSLLRKDKGMAGATPGK